MSHLGHRTYAIHETALCHTINTQKTTRAEFSRRKCMAKYSICSPRLTNLFTFAFLLSFCFFCGCGRLNFINRTRLRHELSPEITERVLLSLLETVTVRHPWLERKIPALYYRTECKLHTGDKPYCSHPIVC